MKIKKLGALLVSAALCAGMPLYKKLDMKNHQLCFHLYGFR